MEILISIFFGLIGGFLGALVFQRTPPLRALFKPIKVEKRGPFIYAVESKHKPKSLSDRAIWERENGLGPVIKPD